MHFLRSRAVVCFSWKHSSVISSADYGDYVPTSDCGSEAWANGVTVIDNEDYVLGIQLECKWAVGSACPVPEGLLLSISTLAPTTAPIAGAPTTAPITEAPATAPIVEAPTTAPMASPPTLGPSVIVETPSPEIRVGFRGDCTVNSCDADLCCSETGECGGTSSYCREGRCCLSDDESDCELGQNQCLIETKEPVAWYESPVFIGLSTAAGLAAAIGDGVFTFYRHVRCGGVRSCTSTRTPTM